MHRPEFYAKVAMDEQQIVTKKRIGCDGLEYQFLPGDFTPDMRYLIGRAEKERLVELYPASSVHPPLALSNIDDILIPSGSFVLEECMRIAQMSAEARKGRCITVTHVTHSLRDFDRRMLDDMVRELDRLFDLFPDVDIVLENITPFRDLRRGIPDFSNGYYDAPVCLAEHFGMEGRLFTCLDICHAQMSDMYLSAIGKIINPHDGLPFDHSLEGYFDLYAERVGLIHLATFTGSGYTGEFGQHGSGFNHETGEGMDTLRLFFDLYGKHGLECPITIEVYEDDYLKSNIYAASKAACDFELGRRGHVE